MPLGPLRRLRQGAWRGARSCNLAVWRADLDRVDGFDADYIGWGKEDSDIIVCLLHAGVRRKDGVFAIGVLHLWHPEAGRDRLAENERKLSDIVASDTIRARRGLSPLKAASGGSTVAAHASMNWRRGAGDRRSGFGGRKTVKQQANQNAAGDQRGGVQKI